MATPFTCTLARHRNNFVTVASLPSTRDTSDVAFVGAMYVRTYVRPSIRFAKWAPRRWSFTDFLNLLENDAQDAAFPRVVVAVLRLIAVGTRGWMEKGAERDGVVDPGWATRERGGMKSSVHGRFDESDYVEWERTAGTEIEAERLDVDERAAPSR